MPLTTRVPQNGGVGTGLSIATSERVGRSAAAVSTGRTADPARIRRGRSSGSTAPGTPRLTPMIASIRRNPSKASLA